MLNQFFLQREILTKIEKVQALARSVKLKASNKIRERSKYWNIKIPGELQNKMCEAIVSDDQKVFDCKFCGKQFNDGRKLGGHISRAHPFQKLATEQEISKQQVRQELKEQKMSNETKWKTLEKHREQKRQENCKKRVSQKQQEEQEVQQVQEQEVQDEKDEQEIKIKCKKRNRMIRKFIDRNKFCVRQKLGMKKQNAQQKIKKKQQIFEQ